jgi:hypothetical protein
MRGKEAQRQLVDDWRFGGSFIADEGARREAYNIMLSMPRGTDPLIVQRAAREFAQAELTDHKYVMVLHDHQANPHVHISVRAESRSGRRLNPRKADLHRWRETFAEKLRAWGVDAEATRQASRGQVRNYEALWRRKALDEGRAVNARPGRKSGSNMVASREVAAEAWAAISQALASSPDEGDRRLARAVSTFVREMPAWQPDSSRDKAREVTRRT